MCVSHEANIFVSVDSGDSFTQHLHHFTLLRPINPRGLLLLARTNLTIDTL